MINFARYCLLAGVVGILAFFGWIIYLVWWFVSAMQ